MLKLKEPKTNTIYRGDNLHVMKTMSSNSVDLVYIDPPFFTQKDYQNIWGDKESVQDYSDFNGFRDTKDYFEKHVSNGAKGLHAYLTWMRARLEEIYRILKDDGSFYCHIDYHASHYLKVILDEIFGYNNFQNEIIWRRKTGSNSTGKAKRYPSNTDTIFYYTKTKSYKFNPQFLPHDPEYIKKAYRHDDGDGRGPYRLDNMAAPSYSPTLVYSYKGYQPPSKGWRYNLEKMKKLDSEGRLNFPKNKSGRISYKRYLSDVSGTPIENLWTDIGMLQDNSPEKMGWPTQKPVALLERIIKTSSNEGDVVFDCFAGCGTAMHAAHNLKRKWVGIDISPTAIEVNNKRLTELGAKVNIIDEKDLNIPELKKAG